MKKTGIYKSSNCTFDPKTIGAFSYGWWKFVGVVEGKVIFNNYFYSSATSKHQSNVRRLLQELDISIDMEFPVPDGLPGSHRRNYSADSASQDNQTLDSLITQAEEYLCDKHLERQLRNQEKYQRSKFNKMKLKLSIYLENSVHFRDYKILDASQFGKYNKIAVHQIVNIKEMEYDVNNAINNFQRDGFDTIIFYV